MMANAELDQDYRLARQLERTWPAFFDRFGRLTAVQRAAIPEILAGRDALLCAPTASGKTEAVCAPLIETHLDRTGRWTILYVSPTRALVNDLYERLLYPTESLRLRLARRTGDHRNPIDPPPHILITTPESFDSLLCRGRCEGSGHVLSSVIALVLDEVHLLHGNPRGEQLRWLIERLRRLRRQAHRCGWCADEKVQIAALSATVPDPEAVLNAYARDGLLIPVGGSREIETVDTSSATAAAEAALPAYLAGLRHPEKILVFSNARKRVDLLAAELRPCLESLGYEVRAHHGSLSKHEREAAEAAIKAHDRIVLFATSTLEIGVDIGDVDLVVLDGPAPDVPALLQRIGRGNRRANKTRVMTCAGSMAEVIIHSAMIEAARNGELGPVEKGPNHAVARQQVASYIFQAPLRARPRIKVRELLQACGPPTAVDSFLDHLITSDELLEDRAGVRLGTTWLDRASRGDIHSNIEAATAATIVDEATGTEIAHGVHFSGGTGLKVGGNLLQARRWAERKLEVRHVSEEELARGHWGYASRRWISGAGQPQAVRCYLGLAPHQWPVLTQGAYSHVFHFGGSRRCATMKLLIARHPEVERNVTVNAWFLTVPAFVESKPDWLLDTSPALLEMTIARHLDSLESALGRPLANRCLPLDLRIDEVRGWLQLDRELGDFQASEWVTPIHDDLCRALLVLKEGIAATRRM